MRLLLPTVGKLSTKRDQQEMMNRAVLSCSSWRAPLGALVVSLLAAGTISCGHGSGASGAAGAAKPAPQENAVDDPTCPVLVAGTAVAVFDTATGGALEFSSTSASADVQQRAQAMGAMHNRFHGEMGPLPDGTAPAGSAPAHDHQAMLRAQQAASEPQNTGHAGHAEHAGHAGHAGHAAVAAEGAAVPFGKMIGVHAKAVVTNVDSGARIEFIVAPADVASLQQELRMHATHLSAGSCRM